jgi:hypothetical protein
MQSGTLGSIFTRDLKGDKELAEAYKGAIGREAKAAFREDWRRKKVALAEKKVQMHKEQRHELSDQIVGTYKPFRKLWEAEGLDKEGWMATRVETRKCIRKGLHNTACASFDKPAQPSAWHRRLQQQDLGVHQ